MKFLNVLLLFGLMIAINALKRPYTTPSPHGSYRLKQIKCSCTEEIYDYLHRNFTCYAKAISREVTTANAYAMIKKQINNLWFTTLVEFKYGTIYRPIMNFSKHDGCELLSHFRETSHPLLKVVFKYIAMLSDVHPTFKRLLKDGCPFKVGEEFSAYNFTIDTKHLPSLFNQGDYRAIIRVFMGKIDNHVCNDTIIASVISPIKESFGKK